MGEQFVERVETRLIAPAVSTRQVVALDTAQRHYHRNCVSVAEIRALVVQKPLPEHSRGCARQVPSSPVVVFPYQWACPHQQENAPEQGMGSATVARHPVIL